MANRICKTQIMHQNYKLHELYVLQITLLKMMGPNLYAVSFSWKRFRTFSGGVPQSRWCNKTTTPAASQTSTVTAKKTSLAYWLLQNQIRALRWRVFIYSISCRSQRYSNAADRLLRNPHAAFPLCHNCANNKVSVEASKILFNFHSVCLRLFRFYPCSFRNKKWKLDN